jgi:hypothetical protein
VLPESVQQAAASSPTQQRRRQALIDLIDVQRREIDIQIFRRVWLCDEPGGADTTTTTTMSSRAETVASSEPPVEKAATLDNPLSSLVDDAPVDHAADMKRQRHTHMMIGGGGGPQSVRQQQGYTVGSALGAVEDL